MVQSWAKSGPWLAVCLFLFLPAVAGLHIAISRFLIFFCENVKLLIQGPKASEIMHATQRGHDGYDGEVTFGLGGHFEAEIASKKFA